VANKEIFFSNAKIQANTPSTKKEYLHRQLEEILKSFYQAQEPNALFDIPICLGNVSKCVNCMCHYNSELVMSKAVITTCAAAGLIVAKLVYACVGCVMCQLPMPLKQILHAHGYMLLIFNIWLQQQQKENLTKLPASQIQFPLPN
jgi:hypothetical protein